MSQIMKVIDERGTKKQQQQQQQQTKKKNKTKKQRRKRTRETKPKVKKWELNEFCCAFKLGFLQLISKASLIFKSNLELALSVILKERELSESKHVGVECRCLKI